MARRIPLPTPDVPLIDTKTGLPNEVWRQWFSYIDSRGITDSPDVDVTGIANGQTLLWNSATGKWEDGAN